MENNLKKYFEEIETEEDYKGYFFSISAALTIALCGTFCGLKNMKQIHQWATNDKIKTFLSDNYDIKDIVCYSWFTQVLGFIKPKSFSECFTKWVMSEIESVEDKTLSFDGKTVRSTGKMKKYTNPLHIVSAQLAEYGITIAQTTVDGKSNEIPAVRELIELLNVKGCMIVADAMHCQKETAKKIIENGGDYLLSVKDNQLTLKSEIVEYIQEKSLRQTMDKIEKTEKNRERIEKRTSYSTNEIGWLYGREEWAGIASIGAVNTQFETENGITDEWHYFISSRQLSAIELLSYARKEWSVEVMHWLLDVHFMEDSCRAVEQNTQENLNIIRKIALNSMRTYKNSNNSKAAFSHLMLDCLIEPSRILSFFYAVSTN